MRKKDANMDIRYIIGFVLGIILTVSSLSEMAGRNNKLFYIEKTLIGTGVGIVAIITIVTIIKIIYFKLI